MGRDYLLNNNNNKLLVGSGHGVGLGLGVTQLTNAMFCEQDEDLSLRSGVSLQQVSPLLISQCGSYKLKLEVSPPHSSPVIVLVINKNIRGKNQSKDRLS